MNSIVDAAIRHGTLEERFGDDFDSAERLKIAVLGVGGAGNNTINRLSRMGVSGAQLIAVNSDRKDLSKLDGAVLKVLIGAKLMRGLGAGGFPELGAKAAESSRHELAEVLSGTHLLFLCAGMGGGTGTGAAPIIADIAKEAGAIVIGCVTFPFKLERARLEKARDGIEQLRKIADTVIIIDNNKLVEYVPNLPIDKAFSVADEIVARAVKGITDTIMEPSLINIDFADIKAVMGGGRVAVISVGDGAGPERVEEVAKNTLSHPLLDVDYKGAKGALIHISGGGELSLGDANSIGERITEQLDPGASVTWGARVSQNIGDRIEAMAIITGVRSPNILGSRMEFGESDEESLIPSLYTRRKEDDWDIKGV